MFARSYRRTIRGRIIELDLYTPEWGRSPAGLVIRAETLILARRNHRDWAWVFGVRILGFGFCVAAPRG